MDRPSHQPRFSQSASSGTQSSSIPEICHGGTVHRLRRERGQREAYDVIDASANINPVGPPPWLRQVVASSVSDLVHYPDAEAAELVNSIATYYGVERRSVVVGNGSSELFAWLPRVEPARPWLVPVPCYGEYRRAPALAGQTVVEIPCGEDLAIDVGALETALRQHPNGLVMIGHPSNPAGRLLDVDAVCRLAGAFPDALVCVDEAFGDFITDFPSFIPCRPANMLVMCSATKIAAIPGLRLGWLIADPGLAERFRLQLPPWSVNHIAQVVGQRLLADHEFIRKSRESCALWRAELVTALEDYPALSVFPGVANYVMVRIDDQAVSASDIATICLDHGVALRTCHDYPGLGDRWLRCAVKPPKDTRRIARAVGVALSQLCGDDCVTLPSERETSHSASAPAYRALMIQGCSSDAGKSVLVAALCRCLAQDGVDVAPFKAQNMSNNAGVDAGGRELGRAQVTQARASGLAPHVDMNPVLLKPNSDTGCQVIVDGKPIGNRDVTGYIATKQHCKQAALAAFDRLAQRHEVIICEGAGSPGEINLRANDFVNMGFVEERDMPVLLVGDIDRGGCYASFVGHLEVMAEWERQRVQGLLVNRFRGDASLLGPAHDYVRDYTGAEVIGVVPHISNLGLPDEDRLSLERRAASRPAADAVSGVSDGGESAPLEIAVIALPHIANSDDLDPFEGEPDIQLRFVTHLHELGNPAAIVLPGSKNVIGDGQWLSDRGLADAIVQFARTGGAVVGLCAGFQLLGTRICDPDHIESSVAVCDGLGLLGHDTILERGKVTRLTRGQHQPSGMTVTGYEIHHGRSESPDDAPIVVSDDGRHLGYQRGRVWGSYLHGIFDSDELRRWWIDELRTMAGRQPLGRVQVQYDLDGALDRLAAVFRESVDLERVYRLLGLAEGTKNVTVPGHAEKSEPSNEQCQMVR